MLNQDARDKLLQAAAEFMAVEHDHTAGDAKLSMAMDSLNLRARLYVEEIGPRQTDKPERQYGQNVHGHDPEEEE